MTKNLYIIDIEITAKKFRHSMPLLHAIHPFPNATFAVWQIEEEEMFFQENLVLSAVEIRELEALKGRRRQEWLAVRWLLHDISGHALRLPLAKDAFSKPFFTDQPGLACSLSHSQKLVGALLVEQGGGAVGCDLQVLVEKMPRLAPKFLNFRETEFIRDQPRREQFVLQHLFWTAKESLYKAYGIKELDFRAHLEVAPFVWNGTEAMTIGHIRKNTYDQSFRLWMKSEERPAGSEYVWTVCAPLES